MIRVSSRLRLAAVVCCAMLLGACGTPGPTQTSTIGDATHLAALEQLQNFRVTGGIGIWTDEQSISAGVDWQQAGQDLTVKLTAPLGFTSLELEQTPGQATLTRGDAAPMQGESGAVLLQQALGLAVPVPLDQMGQWIRGLPGSADSVLFDEAGRVQSIAYLDPTGVRWNAQVRKRTTVDDVSLPALITARGGPYNLRLVLKEWNKKVSTPEAPPAQGPKRIPIPASSAGAS